MCRLDVGVPLACDVLGSNSLIQVGAICMIPQEVGNRTTTTYEQGQTRNGRCADAFALLKGLSMAGACVCAIWALVACSFAAACGVHSPSAISLQSVTDSPPLLAPPPAQADPAQPPPPIPPTITPPVPTPIPAPVTTPVCTNDLRLPGVMSDIVSNVLLRSLRIPDKDVKAFVTVAKSKYATGEAVRTAAADHFKIDQKQMADLVEYWQHINCSHAAIPGYAVPDAALDAATGDALTPLPTSAFAADVALHVILHELGHAVIREFDLMVLGNEETMADAFATYLLTQHLPDRALPAITARVTSLMIEANEVPRDQWTVRGEHDSDARRAYQIAALAVAADQKKYASVAEIVGMSEREIRMAHDYGADIHRAWRRTLTPLMMPEGKRSTETRIRADAATQQFVEFGEPSLISTIESAITRIDWHSQITVEFVSSTGGAAWNRGKRTITVNSEYLRRFIAQGVKAAASGTLDAR